MDVINMEVKIKQGTEMLDATIEVVDGVMVVSPKEEKVDITKFKDGDVITCGYSEHGGFQWTAILQGEIERIADNMFIGDYCSLDCKGEFFDCNSNSDSATWVRYATEEEKKKLFDKLAEEGYEFDFEKKEFVKLRWKPKIGEKYYATYFCTTPSQSFVSVVMEWRDDQIDYNLDGRGWCFKDKEECQDFCNRLNQAIEGIKP